VTRLTAAGLRHQVRPAFGRGRAPSQKRTDMPDTSSLAEAYLEHCPACQWIVSEDLRFHRIYGDSIGVFHKPAAELEGRILADCLAPETAADWKDRFNRALKGETLWLRLRHENAIWYTTVFPINRPNEPVCAGGLAREITPWNTAEQELRHTVLSALKAQEFDRSMASKFLHDIVGQNLTALGLQLDLARMDVETISPETCDRIASIQKVLEGMMEQVREYSYELNPSAVERAGLRSALDRLIVRLRERFPGVVRVNVDPFLKIDPKIATAMYHIAQEAIENAVQHASCSAIEIAVKSTRTGSSLEVHDNGKGFDPADILETRRGLGLLSMEHYAAQAGMDLSIASNREDGTTVRASADGSA
jgi:signal transduction histidine kinase